MTPFHLPVLAPAVREREARRRVRVRLDDDALLRALENLGGLGNPDAWTRSPADAAVTRAVRVAADVIIERSRRRR